jgi:hypothetical protein
MISISYYRPSQLGGVAAYAATTNAQPAVNEGTDATLHSTMSQARHFMPPCFRGCGRHLIPDGFAIGAVLFSTRGLPNRNEIRP